MIHVPLLLHCLISVRKKVFFFYLSSISSLRISSHIASMRPRHYFVIILSNIDESAGLSSSSYLYVRWLFMFVSISNEFHNVSKCLMTTTRQRFVWIDRSSVIRNVIIYILKEIFLLIIFSVC